jgi:hypothetical protein
VNVKWVKPEIGTGGDGHTFPGADHGISYLVDRERYSKIVTAFIASVLE